MKSNPVEAPATPPPPSVVWEGPPIALFWDQSLVWGLICVQTLQQLEVPFRLVSAAEIAQGALDRHRILLVPGGWAAHKMQALGDDGQDRIRHFVSQGGSYLGFCGGAGLALSSPPSLGMVPVERLPLKDRLPSASGQILVAKAGDHPLWQHLPEVTSTSIWWPSQFKWEPHSSSRVLASYASLGKDFWIADLPVCDLAEQDMDCATWEGAYGINLDPARLLGQPAMIESRCGNGRLLLSYPHLETPGDAEAHRLLINILRYLDEHAAPFFPKQPTACSSASPQDPSGPGREALEHFCRAADEVNALIRFGERHLLWNWRLPWLLHWRRGIRGLEYGSLAVLLQTAVREAHRIDGNPSQAAAAWSMEAQELQQNVHDFCSLAQRLLLEEKLAGHSGKCSKLGRINASVDQLRTQLFGVQMNHGGLCRAIFDQLDRLLFQLLSTPPQTPSG